MSARYRNLGFLASHRGTNMQAILDACREGRIDARPVVVISNNGASGALDRARAEGVPAYHLGGRHFPDDTSLDEAITETLQKHEVDLVILAGYMKKIGPRMLSAFPGSVINVHPGLLPEYGGRGMYGMKVHEAVIAAGAAETGVSIHVVDDEYDHGPVLAEQLGVEYTRLKNREISAAVIEKVPAKFASHYHLMPLTLLDGVLKVAIADPFDIQTLDEQAPLSLFANLS